jgi:hypothetical protein
MLRTQRIDGFLFIHRSTIASTIVAAIVFVIACLVATLVGFAWRPDPFAPFGVSEEVTALLAVGTLALGFAALVQAESRLETTDSQLRPNLVLDWNENEAGTRLVEGHGLSVRNVGPAVAKSVDCVLSLYETPAEARKHFEQQAPPSKPLRIVHRGRSSIERGETFRWDTQLSPEEPAQLNALLELRSKTVFDRPAALRAYLLTGKSVAGFDRSNEPLKWNEWTVLEQTTWQIWEVPEE